MVKNNLLVCLYTPRQLAEGPKSKKAKKIKGDFLQ